MTAVYEWYDAGDHLLYIGISENVMRRSGEHEQNKQWWDQVTKAKVTHYPTREEAIEVERILIRHLQPLFNVTHKERQAHRPVSSQPRRHVDDEDGRQASVENMYEQARDCMFILKDAPSVSTMTVNTALEYLKGQGFVTRRSIVARALASLKRGQTKAIPGGEWIFREGTTA